MSRGVVCSLAIAALAASSMSCGAEPPLAVARDVDFSRFQGKWYEIAKLPRVTQTDCYGTTAFYTKTSDLSLQLVNQCNVGSTVGPVKTVTMNATVPDTSVPAKLALQVGDFSGDYWILEVGADYAYAVVGHPSRLYLWILSRSPTLDSDTLQGIVSRAQKNDFDTSQLEYTPQPLAGERVSSPVPVGPIPPALGTGCSVAPAESVAHPWGLAWIVAAFLAMARRSTRRIGAGWKRKRNKDSTHKTLT
jgi:apolipoprotein D and lipocalin family protein